VGIVSRFFLWGLILLAGTLPVPAQGIPPRQAEFLRALAAEIRLQCERNPQRIQLWIQLGDVLLQLEELEPAGRAWARARQLDPANQEIRARFAYLRFLQGERKASLQELRALAGGEDCSARILYFLGVCERSVGQIEAAEKSFRQAQQCDSTDVASRLAWLEILRARLPVAELLASYRELLELAPHNATLHLWFAEALIDIGKPVAAISEGRLLVEQHPDWIPAQLVLARAYFAANDDLSTIFVLEHLPREKLDAPASLTLGKAKARLGLPEDAVRYLELSIRLGANALEAQRELAQVYLFQGLHARAEELLGSLLAQSPDDYDTGFLWANLLVQRGEYDRALSFLRGLAQRDLSRPEAFEGQGYIALRRGDWEGARDALQKAASRSSTNPRVYEELGQALSRLGEHEKALDALRRAIQLMPSRAEPHYIAGRILQRLGRLEEAKRALESAKNLSQQQRGAGRGGMTATPPVPNQP